MKDGHIRVVVVVIEDGKNTRRIFRKKINSCFFVVEKLVSKGERNAERTFNDGKKKTEDQQTRFSFSFIDFAKMIPPLMEKYHPAYFFIRLDTISEISGHNWLLITFIPDDAKVTTTVIVEC